MSNMAMKYEDWLRECVHHDGEIVYLPCDIVLAIADWIEAHRDAVPVIWCKDCKHWQPSEYGVVEQPYCKHLGYKEETGLDIRIGNENDFCSFGERKDDESVDS